MKDYHFEKDEDRFNETIRLDDINEKVKELKHAQTEDELGDANAFLNAFESEKFDLPAEDVAQQEGLPEMALSAEEAEPIQSVFPVEELGDTKQPGMPVLTEGDTRQPSVPVLTKTEPMPETEEEPETGMNKKTIGLLAILGVLVFIIGFSLVRCGFHPAKISAEGSGEVYPVLVESLLNEEELIVYHIGEKARKTLHLTEETEIIDEQGRTIAYGSVRVGDLVMAELSEDGETVYSIDYSDEALRTEEQTGLSSNTAAHTLQKEGVSFTYGDKTLFLYGEEEIDPADIMPCDVLVLKSVEDTVWSVEIKEYHGYIVLENTANIKDGTFQLDEDTAIPLQDAKRIPATEGSHTVTVQGSNIETRKDTVMVKVGEETVCDLSKAQEKMGVIIVDANVSDYKLYVNGALQDGPAVLPMGEHDLVILKKGYKEWNQHVTLNQDTLHVHAELQWEDIQYGTLTVTANCDGARVYVNGEDSGIAPMQINLPYGSYHVKLEKDGYQPYEQSIQMNGAQASLHAEMQ